VPGRRWNPAFFLWYSEFLDYGLHAVLVSCPTAPFPLFWDTTSASFLLCRCNSSRVFSQRRGPVPPTFFDSFFQISSCSPFEDRPYVRSFIFFLPGQYPALLSFLNYRSGEIVFAVWPKFYTSKSLQLLPDLHPSRFPFHLRVTSSHGVRAGLFSRPSFPPIPLQYKSPAGLGTW